MNDPVENTPRRHCVAQRRADDGQRGPADRRAQVTDSRVAGQDQFDRAKKGSYVCDWPFRNESQGPCIGLQRSNCSNDVWLARPGDKHATEPEIRQSVSHFDESGEWPSFK